MKRKIAFALEGAFLTLQKACRRLFMGTSVYLPTWITEIPKMRSTDRKKRRKEAQIFIVNSKLKKAHIPLAKVLKI